MFTIRGIISVISKCKMLHFDCKEASNYFLCREKKTAKERGQGEQKSEFMFMFFEFSGIMLIFLHTQI